MSLALNRPDLLADILRAFGVAGSMTAAESFGSGHINEIYRLSVRGPSGRRRYLLRRINTRVFRRPELVVRNTVRVTRHLAERLAAENLPDAHRRVLTLLPTPAGESCHWDEEGVPWCLFPFIEGTVSVNEVGEARQAFDAARVVGHFQRLTADLAPADFPETIPGFHDGPGRLAALEQAVAADAAGRVATAAPEIGFAREHAELCHRLTARLADGTLPVRVTHNDTKLNNVLLDAATGEGLCLTDLDTVMPGTVLYDYGDMVRSFTPSFAEDARDAADGVRVPVFEALTRGYVAEARAVLTPGETAHLLLGAEFMVWIIGIRFLTDYLAGDIYFRVQRPDHNLDRCRTQFRLLAELQRLRPRLSSILSAALEG
ncbi:MAG: aminoglycoside phosphotransferase family protein [Acidobacteria bacterium]|nr:aminoglycoside phosphotransferase family protein [Acidobacteriota bacterium]